MPTQQHQQDSSKEAKYSKKRGGDQRQDREVVIYDNADKIREHMRDVQTQGGGAEPYHPRPVQRPRSFRGAAVCLGVLSLLMTSGVIVLLMMYISATSETEKLLNRFNQSNDWEIINQLQGNITDLTEKNRELQKERQKPEIKTKECSAGWTRFGCSCYFKSTEIQTWSLSSSSCESKGSNLVIINSREEHDFVTKLNTHEEFWIGLRITEDRRTSTGHKWEWVDNSTLTETSWADGLSLSPTDQFYAAYVDQQGKWKQSANTVERNFLCET